MTRIISVLNFKGGTGKTATVVNMGMGLALRGHRVLAIDLDPQGSVAGWLGVNYHRSIADVLSGAADWTDCVERARARFDIIAADRRLADTEHLLIEQLESTDVLSRRLAGVEQAGYEYILLDCAPSIDIVSESALGFAHEVFVPVSMEYLAMVGARMVIIEVLRARRLTAGQSARLSLVIPTFYDARLDKSHETLDMLEKHFPRMVAPPIRLSVSLSEAPSHQQTVFEYDLSGVGSIDYARLVEHVVGMTTG
jgi:chromosome partitioning protein